MKNEDLQAWATMFPDDQEFSVISSGYPFVLGAELPVKAFKIITIPELVITIALVPKNG